MLLQSAWAWLSNDLLVSCEKYAQAIGRFISVVLNNVDMQKWNLVGIGHSIVVMPKSGSVRFSEDFCDP